jgi:hypothetical protein
MLLDRAYVRADLIDLFRDAPQVRIMLLESIEALFDLSQHAVIYFLPTALPGLGVVLWTLPGGGRPPSLPGAKFLALSPGSLECPGVAPGVPLSRCPGAVGERPFCCATTGALKTIAAMTIAVTRIMIRSIIVTVGPATNGTVRAESGSVVRPTLTISVEIFQS